MAPTTGTIKRITDRGFGFVGQVHGNVLAQQPAAAHYHHPSSGSAAGGSGNDP